MTTSNLQSGRIGCAAVACTLALAGVARAEEPREAAAAVVVRGGRAKFTGDLTTDASAPMGALSVLFIGSEHDERRESNDVKRALGGFDFRTHVDFESTRVTQKGSFEVVPPGEKVDISEVAITFDLCALASTPVQICPYFGFGQVELRDHQDHGNRYLYSLSANPYGVVIPYTYRFGGYGVTAGYQLNTFRVAQVVDRKKSGFTETSSGVFVGIAF